MYKVTIENNANETATEIIESGEFETRKEAMSFKRKMTKKHGLYDYAGHTVNLYTNKELYTNF